MGVDNSLICAIPVPLHTNTPADQIASVYVFVDEVDVVIERDASILEEEVVLEDAEVEGEGVLLL